METPFELKSCHDCKYLKPLVNFWCGNVNAIKARGTAIPGCVHCKFWEPDWKHIEKRCKTKENGYVKQNFIKRIINLFK